MSIIHAPAQRAQALRATLEALCRANGQGVMCADPVWHFLWGDTLTAAQEVDLLERQVDKQDVWLFVDPDQRALVVCTGFTTAARVFRVTLYFVLTDGEYRRKGLMRALMYRVEMAFPTARLEFQTRDAELATTAIKRHGFHDVRVRGNVYVCGRDPDK